MADYEGRVRITADLSQANREVESFRRNIERTSPTRLALDTASFRQAQQSLAQLQRSIGDLNKTPLNILTGTGAGSSAKSDTFRQLSQSAKDFFSAVASGNKHLSGTTAGLRQQAAAFRNLADNINFADDYQRRFYRAFAQGAEMASAKAAKAGIEQIRALQELYQNGVTAFGEDVNPRAGGLDQLLALGKDLPRTKAALSEYKVELERVFDLVETRSLSGGIIATEISSVEKELLKIERDRAEANDQINDIKRAGYALTGRQLSLEEENLAAIERRIAARRQEQRIANDTYNRSKALSRDFGVNPALTLRPAGLTDQQVARRNLISDRTRAAAEASSFNPLSQRVAEIQNDLPILKSIERNRRKVEKETLREAQATAKNANQANATGRARELRRTRGLSFEERLAARRPDLTPEAKAKNGFARGNVRQAFGEGLIGGAFPLLFGQGLGASVGGFAGGFGGGMVGGMYGFGLSLVGTAIGGAVDTTIQSLKDLAASLKSPTDAIKALETSGFRVGDSLKFQVEQLQAVGRAYDAQTLVLQEVEKRLGKGSVRELNALDTEQKRLGDQWSSIAGKLQSELLPALVGFTGAIANITAAAIGFSNLPGIKQVASVAVEQFSPTLSPIGIARKAFGFVQERGRAIAATSAGNRRQLSPQERFADEKTRTEESRRIADQIQSAYREAFNLQRQAHDLQRDGAMLNRDMADYSYKKEREIFDLRQQVAEKQIENTRASSQNRIESGDLSARQTFAAATGLEQQILTNVREVVRARKEGEADIEQSRSRLELAMAKLNRDVEDYKRTNAREIEDIERRKLSYARSVEDYKRQVADYVLQRSREAADLMRQAMTLPDMAGGSGGPVSPGAKPIAEQLIRRLGLTPAQATGIVGNLQRESGLNPRINEGGQVGLPKRVGGYGVAQWTGPRQENLIRFAGSPQKAGDLGTQIDFLIHELLGPESASLAALRQTRSPEEAAKVFEQKFERAGIVALAERRKYARQAYQQIVGNSPQAQAGLQISNIPAPQFKATPIGATPSAASFNAERMAVLSRMTGSEKEAQRILEDQIKLKQRGIELSQVEQILQSNQLPQLQQQGAALKLQIAARQKILDLSDQDAAIADIEAEAKARLGQIESQRLSTLKNVRKQYGNDPALIKQVNAQFDFAAKIAKGEEKQRRENLDSQNKLQSQDQIRTQILQGQEELAMAKVEAAAMERGELEASNVELLKASTLYRQADEKARAKLEALAGETQELRKQSELRKRLNEMQQETRFAGAGLRAGFIGAGGQAYEQGLKESRGNVDIAKQYAKQAMALEDQKIVWENLTKSITGATDAISGGLTTGLVDIFSSINDTKDGKRVNIGKRFSELGRETFGGVARSFAEPAQQQLSSVLQRQLASVLGGPQGPLVKLFGAGAEVAGPQALGSAAMAASGSLWGFNSALLAVGASLQGIAAQSAFTGALSGAGGVGAAFANSIPGVLNGFGGGTNILNSIMPGISFGGFLANGGNTRPGEGYIVGENEPEFFFPGVSGRVVPKSDMEKAANLRAANSKSDTIDVSYTVTEQQGQRFVTEEQFRKSNAALLQRSQAVTYAGMRNNSGIRDFVGI